MTDTFPKFDPAIYNPHVMQTEVVAGPAPAANPLPTVDVSKVTQGTDSELEGKAVLRESNREKAPVLASVGAGMRTTWIAPRVYDWLNAPKFDPAPIDIHASVMQLPMHLNEDEDNFLRKGTNSPDAFKWKVQQIENQRLAAETMGDNAGFSAITSILDPSFGPMSKVASTAGRLTTTGRVANKAVTGLTMAGLQTGVNYIRNQLEPVSTEEYISSALMVGAATYFLHDPKTMTAKPKDSLFPHDELVGVANEVKAHVEDTIISKGVVDEATHPFDDGGEFTAALAKLDEGHIPKRITGSLGTEGPQMKVSGFERPATSGRLTLDNLRSLADPKLAAFADLLHSKMGGFVDDVSVYTVPKNELSNQGRAYYAPSKHAIFISSESPPGTILHEMTHALTHSKIEFGLKFPESAHGKIVQDMDKLRIQVQEYAKANNLEGHEYYVSNLHEFTAGLFTGERSVKFTDILSKIPDSAGSGTVFSSLVNNIRKLLGFTKSESNGLLQAIGLTDKLMDTRLNTTIEVDGYGPTSKSYRLEPPPEGNAQQVRAEVVKRMDLSAQSLGEAISVSLHKKLSSLGPTAKRITDMLFDDPLDMSGDSVASQKSVIKSDLAKHQFKYEDGLLAEMANRGFGFWNRYTKQTKAMAMQETIEREVANELWHRERYTMDGFEYPDSGAPKEIKDLADIHGSAYKAALIERKRSGELGADTVLENPGYFTRRMNVTKIEGLESRLVADGYTEKAAKSAVIDLVARGITSANGWDAQLAKDVAGAIVNRAKARGYYEDNAFRGHVGNEAAKEVREVLQASGISGDRLQRVMDVLTGVVDEAGKTPTMKHRIDMDMRTTLATASGDVSIGSLIDTDLARIMDSYMDNASGQAAMARKGLVTASDIDKLRTEYLHSITDPAKRESVVRDFDDGINALLGRPVGERINNAMRAGQQVNQMVGLGMSSLWQVSEYANAMGRYGMLKTLQHSIAEMPVFRSVFNQAKHDPAFANDLRNVLANNASQDMRLRPFIQKFEDNFQIPTSSVATIALSQAKQMVPYINGMKWVHHHQARVVGNLIVDTFLKGASGDAKAISALEQYGLKSHTLDSIKGDISKFGTDTSKWNATTWETIRGPLTKMMDEAVLKSRIGEIPAFAQFSQLGKFIFTFRSFVLGSHNKVMAGNLARNGYSGTSLLMLYQFPMTMLSVQAANTLSGKKPLDDKKLVFQTIGQMGALGMFGEIAGIVSGDKQQFGAPGLIFLDRGYKVGNALAQGHYGSATAGAINAIPLISVLPGIKALSSTLKDTPNGSSKSAGSK